MSTTTLQDLSRFSNFLEQEVANGNITREASHELVSMLSTTDDQEYLNARVQEQHEAISGHDDWDAMMIAYADYVTNQGEDEQDSPESTPSSLESLPGYVSLNPRQQEILSYIHSNNPDAVENITIEYITINLPNLGSYKIPLQDTDIAAAVPSVTAKLPKDIIDSKGVSYADKLRDAGYPDDTLLYDNNDLNEYYASLGQDRKEIIAAEETIMGLMPSGDYQYKSWRKSTKEYIELMGVDITQKMGRAHAYGASGGLGHYGCLRLGSVNGYGDGFGVEFAESEAECCGVNPGRLYVARCLTRA